MFKEIAIALLTTLLLTNPAYSETWRDVLPDPKLVGQGEFKWFLFDVYSAKLWSGHLPFSMNAPFALEITYQRRITSEQFVSTSIDEIKRIYGSTYSSEKLEQWRTALTNVFPEVRYGDQLIGVYLPNRGCIFFDKNKRLAEIDDPQLAKAFFGIWLDPRSRDKDLRALLLGANK
jgi:hypothetical protein